MGSRSSLAVASRSFHVLVKPAGASCNLQCTYCFYLEKQSLYSGSNLRMSEELQEDYIRQLLESHPGPEIPLAWQGGEPTLMGLDFYRRAIELVRKFQRPGTRILHTLQTNGVLLDEEWCRFLGEHQFLVGLSLDGPRRMHDAFRVDRGGHGSFDRVLRALRLLQQHGVELNILTSVHDANVRHPREVYRFLRDEAGARFIQLIPIVEREGGAVTSRSVRADSWGRFLIGMLDEWLGRDVGTVFVPIFDATLASWVGARPGTCLFEETCGDCLALEHNGDVYACDHFVEPSHRLGNLRETTLEEILRDPRLISFGRAKRDTLPSKCQACEFRFACRGECPRRRFLPPDESSAEAADPLRPRSPGGVNYLCDGYLEFFRHARRPMGIMAELLRAGRAPSEVMGVLASERRALLESAARAGRNSACPCGSGLKVKRCHGDPRFHRT
ncbi:MAG: anaerobic sulfatase maturase [Deltaproteobacteria bacterium]|nr:anaerobic sulfatase maturase [Deltaproteobacteria bacterium]